MMASQAGCSTQLGSEPALLTGIPEIGMVSKISVGAQRARRTKRTTNSRMRAPPSETSRAGMLKFPWLIVLIWSKGDST